MRTYSPSVTRLINEFAKLPGIGRKTAERLSHHILRTGKEDALGLSDSIRAVKENIRHCQTCFNLSEEEQCGICKDPRRDQGTICVVEQPRDLFSLEQTGTYRGSYHVLLGRIAPLEGTLLYAQMNTEIGPGPRLLLCVGKECLDRH